MPVISLRAHFDGRSIQLDEPFELPNGAPLLITVLPDAADDAEQAGLSTLSATGLALAYVDDEPEYSVADIVL